MTCYIEKPTEYGADQIEFDSGALISREYEPDSHVDIVLLDTKQTSFKQYGLKVHYEKGNNGWDLGGRIDDINDIFMSVMLGRFDE